MTINYNCLFSTSPADAFSTFLSSNFLPDIFLAIPPPTAPVLTGIWSNSSFPLQLEALTGSHSGYLLCTFPVSLDVLPLPHLCAETL